LLLARKQALFCFGRLSDSWRTDLMGRSCLERHEMALL
jgi:hypothetical protein